MKALLLLNIEFFTIFTLFYLTAKLLIIFLIKKLSFLEKYFILKAVPFLTFIVLILNIFIGNTFFNFKNTTDKLSESYIQNSQSILHDNLFLHFTNSFYKYFIVIWIVGMLFFSTKYFFDYSKFRYLFHNKAKISTSIILQQQLLSCTNKLNTSIDTKIFYSKYTETPFTFGVFKPQIIIPDKISKNIEIIIMHELVHCIHYDMLVKSIITFLKIAQWINPIIYLYSLDLDKYCEYACDEKVSVQMSFIDKKNYAQAIIDAAKIYKSPSFLVTFSSDKGLKKRLHNILYPNSQSNKNKKHLLLICALVLTCTGIWLLSNFNISYDLNLLYNESQIKTVKINFLHGQEDNEYYYEEYINGYWWRGTLYPEKSNKLTNDLNEFTFSGEIYKCSE